MRKSIDEKLSIVKQATSKNKIKKLSVQHGITVKTIKNWITQSKEGKFDRRALHTVPGSKPKKNIRIKRPLKNFVYKVSKIESPVKNGNSDCFRHLFRDAGRGFMFCACSSDKSAATIKNICEKFIKQITTNGYVVRKITTDKIPETQTIGSCLKEYGLNFERRRLVEIKPYTKFSLKKNSFIKERTKYECMDEFIVDSLATAAKNNDIILEETNAGRDLIRSVKSINMVMHVSDSKKIEDMLKDHFDTAVEYHKKYDFVNADSIYEKIYHILRGSNLQEQLFLSVLLQRAKISGLSKRMDDLKKYISEGLKYIRRKKSKVRLKDEYKFIYILADRYRIENKKKKSLYYMDKLGALVEKGGDESQTALYYINRGRTYFHFKKVANTLECYDRAKVIIKKYDLANMRPFLEESYADTYSMMGDYESTKKVYKKMLNEGFYEDSPYFQALLYAKYADQFHLTGDLSRSIKYYDKALELTSKNSELKIFKQLGVTVRSNQAYTKVKKHQFSEARKMFINCLEIAKEQGFKDQIFSNLCFILICDCESGNLKDSEKYLKDTAAVMKNVNKPVYEYKYLLIKGDICRIKKDYLKAEQYFLRSLSVSKEADNVKTGFFEVSLKLLDLYSMTDQYKKAVPIADDMIKKASAKNFTVYSFKAGILKKKGRYFYDRNISEYLKYLNKLRETAKNEEKNLFVVNEIRRLSDG